MWERRRILQSSSDRNKAGRNYMAASLFRDEPKMRWPSIGLSLTGSAMRLQTVTGEGEIPVV